MPSTAPSSGLSAALQRLAPREGVCVFLKRGQSLRVVNTHGYQVVDFWCFVQRSAAAPEPGSSGSQQHRLQESSEQLLRGGTAAGGAPEQLSQAFFVLCACFYDDKV